MATKTVLGNVVTAVTNNIAKIKTAIGNATTSAAGLMSSTDKTKLDGVAASANKTTIVNNLTATTAGSALDATQGKALSDEITSLNDSLTKHNSYTVKWTNSAFTTSVSVYNLNLFKIGKLVIFNNTILVNSEVPASSTLISSGGIPSEYKPITNNSINVYGKTIMLFYANGGVALQNISESITAGFHVISGCYFTN